MSNSLSSDTLQRDAKKSISLPFKIRPLLSYAQYSLDITEHVTNIEKVIRKCIPPHLFQLSSTDFKTALLQELPIFLWNKPESAPGCINITFLNFSSKEGLADNKLIDILKSWIIPGKITPLLSSEALHFHWDLFPNDAFLVLQVKLLIKNGKELNKALSHLPSLSTQIISSLKNSHAFRLFFPHRPLLEDMKHAQVHQELIFLIEKFPSLFDSSLLLEMSRFFALCSKSFFNPRNSRLITKIVSSHYLMRINLLRHLSLYPEKRHIEVRFIRTELDFCFGSKSVLGLILGIAPLDKHEIGRAHV